jgi:hypothetical protein
MVPYWLLFSLFAAGALASRERPDWHRSGGVFFAGAGALLILLIGLRHEVGGDWGAYIRLFHHFRYVGIDGIFSVSGAEPAYAALNVLAHTLGLDIWFVNLVCAAFFTWGLIRLARLQPQPWLAILVATPFLIIVVGMGYTRQSAAVGFFMLALAALLGQKPAKAVMWVIIGSSFHTSALVTLPFLMMAYARNRLQVGLLTIAAGILGYFTLLAPELERYTQSYIEDDYQAQGATIRLLMNLIPAAIFLLLRKRFDLEPLERRVWTFLALAALVSFGALFFTNATVVLDRLSLYIIPIQMFVFSRLPSVLSQKSTFMLTWFVILFSGLVQFTWLTYADHAEYWVPYQNVTTATNRW